MTRWICVTGMHRSGTSALSRVLNLLGVDLGDEGRLIGPAPDNPKGFWENQSLAMLNDGLLQAFGGSWDNPPHFPRGWADRPELGAAREQARALLTGSFHSPPAVGGWKDPRTSLLLPFWRHVVPVHRTVLALRDPREVAGSLRTRQGFDSEHSARLWLRYTLEALRNDPDHVLVAYDHLLTDPRAVAERLVAALDLPEPDAETLAQIDEFVEPTLRRSDQTDDGGPAMAIALSTWHVLRATPDKQYQQVLSTFADAVIPWAEPRPAPAAAAAR